MRASEIKRRFAERMNSSPYGAPERLELRGEDLWVLKESSSDGRLSEDIRIEASDDEWEEYYLLVSEDDEDPFSLMWVHLNETVAEAENRGGSVAVVFPYLRMR